MTPIPNLVNVKAQFYSIRDSVVLTYPQLQMSTIGPYLSSPNKSSGGRYQSVITLLVYGRSLSSAWYNRAKPKSASFIWPLHNNKSSHKITYLCLKLDPGTAAVSRRR